MQIGRVLARVTAVLLYPVAIPAWLFEVVVRLFRPRWEFNTFSVTPYFLMLVALASYGLETDRSTLWWGSLYILTALEILGLWVCLSIAIARESPIQEWLREFGRRRTRTKRGILLKPRALFGGVMAYGFTIYYFAAVNMIVLRYNPSALVGADDSSGLWDYLYYSVITITTLGYGDIHPNSKLAEGLAMAEVLLGFCFVIFLFGAFVSYRIGRLQETGAHAKE